jgi:hypothetical protein
LIDPEYADILRSLYGLAVVRDGKAYFQSYFAQQDNRYRIELRNFGRKQLAALKGLLRLGQRETFRT